MNIRDRYDAFKEALRRVGVDNPTDVDRAFLFYTIATEASGKLTPGDIVWVNEYMKSHA